MSTPPSIFAASGLNTVFENLEAFRKIGRRTPRHSSSSSVTIIGRGILAGLLYIALGFGIGWLLGGPDTDTRRVMALGTSQRNIAAALVVASQSFSDPKVVVMVIVVAIVGLIILMPLSRALAHR
jgi:predicted Na+-dependent transporter